MAAAAASGAAGTETAAAVTPADVAAVYVATPAALHEEHALMAIAAGTAVLVEKPLAHNAAAALRIAEAARAAGVFAMEAMWTRFLPLTVTLHDRLTAGALGEPRAFAAEFMGSDRPDAGTSRFDPVQGGALLHRGVYPVRWRFI
jgi:predicted dehydrogenase